MPSSAMAQAGTEHRRLHAVGAFTGQPVCTRQIDELRDVGCSRPFSTCSPVAPAHHSCGDSRGPGQTFSLFPHACYTLHTIPHPSSTMLFAYPLHPDPPPTCSSHSKLAPHTLLTPGLCLRHIRLGRPPKFPVLGQLTSHLPPTAPRPRQF